MPKEEFNYINKTQQYINREIDQKMGKMTAQGLIKSEREYKKVIDNLISSKSFSLGRITSLSEHEVSSDEIIKSSTLNKLFDDLKADLRILYRKLNDDYNILSMNLTRNKSFYKRMKSKVRAMWKEIGHFRESSFNLESADYTFFEGFDAEYSSMNLKNAIIDRRLGKLQLEPILQKRNNKSEDVKEVEVSYYPVANEDGGVIDTSSPSNSLETNYTKGERNMLRDGLWKHQLLTAKIPNSKLDPMGFGNKQSYNGILCYVDITFTEHKLLNQFSIDLYGQFETKLVGMRFKKELNGAWFPINKIDNNEVKSKVTETASDYMSIKNIVPITAVKVRLIFQQENHQTISKFISSVDDMVDKMTKDMLERRYEKLDYSYKFKDALPRVSDTDDDRGTLYDNVIDVIEREGDINSLEGKISDLLIPKPREIKKNISDWNIYNIGAWSIDPETVYYPAMGIGEYHSHKLDNPNTGFRTEEGAPAELTLYTQQSEPPGTLVEWYATNENGSVEIPIVPNNDLWRNEIVSKGEYYPLKTSNKRATKPSNYSTVMKLDFPYHPEYTSEIYLYENGKKTTNLISGVIGMESYNSTELYFSNANFKPGNLYTIKYIPAVIDTVKCWSLVPTDVSNNVGSIDIASAMVFATKDAAAEVRKYIAKNKESIKQDSFLYVSNSYRIKPYLCTVWEYNMWFSNGEVNAFADELLDNLTVTDSNIDPDAIDSKFQIADIPIEKVEFNTSLTRLTWLFKDDFYVTPYSDNNTDLYGWRELPSAPPCVYTRRKHYLDFMES